MATVTLLLKDLQPALKLAQQVATIDDQPVALSTRVGETARLFAANAHVSFWASVAARAEGDYCYILPPDMVGLILSLKKGNTINLSVTDAGSILLQSDGVESETSIIDGFVISDPPPAKQTVENLHKIIVPNLGVDVAISSNGKELTATMDDEVRAVVVKTKEHLPPFSIVVHKGFVDILRKVVTGKCTLSLIGGLTAVCGDYTVTMPYTVDVVDPFPEINSPVGRLGPELLDFLRLTREPVTHLVTGGLESIGHSRISVRADGLGECDIWVTTKHLDPRVYGLGNIIQVHGDGFSPVMLTDGTTSVFLSPHVAYSV